MLDVHIKWTFTREVKTRKKTETMNTLLLAAFLCLVSVSLGCGATTNIKNIILRRWLVKRPVSFTQEQSQARPGEREKKIG